jgi:hypothetical protein
MGLPATAGASGEPRVRQIDCVSSCAAKGRPRGGSFVVLRGQNLRRVFRAIFPGGEGGVRSLRGRVSTASASGVRLRLPWEAVSGRFVVGTTDGKVSRPARISIAPIPVVSRTSCIGSCASGRRPRPGSLLRVRGVRLGAVSSATLHGLPGRGDDRPARVSHQRFGSFRMRVPADAVSGRFSAREADGVRSPVRAIRLAMSPSADPSGVFPVAGAHDYGGAGALFGTRRAGHSHQGHDVFARCGAPLLAARAGRVRYVGYQRSAGHYIVIDGALPDIDYVYMHLRSAARFRTGAVVPAGAGIGEVGESGNARGCHLHFELWSAPGWYEGGRPFDPLPQLRAWER